MSNSLLSRTVTGIMSDARLCQMAPLLKLYETNQQYHFPNNSRFEPTVVRALTIVFCVAFGVGVDVGVQPLEGELRDI